MGEVLLVLGNGFDLKCGLRTSFPNFLSSEFYSPTLEKIKKIDSDLSNALKFPSEYGGNRIYNSYSIDFCELTFWDLYFALPHIYCLSNIEYWYNFENRLNQFIYSKYTSFGAEFDQIKRISNTWLSIDSYKDSKYKRQLILYLYFKGISDSFDEKKISDRLYQQLFVYEKSFGNYIKLIQSRDTNYVFNAKGLIKRMLDVTDKVTCINTFNYSDLSFISDHIWHINGDVDNPIFGVDFPDINPREIDKYRYTKTYRRLKLEGKESYLPTKEYFSKVVVFGHSLNRQDYNYFFALFNAMDLGNVRNYSEERYIEFVYSKYGTKTSEQVKEELLSRVLALFYKYNEEVLHETNFRLIDILFSISMIRFKEI